MLQRFGVMDASAFRFVFTRLIYISAQQKIPSATADLDAAQGIACCQGVISGTLPHRL